MTTSDMATWNTSTPRAVRSRGTALVTRPVPSLIARSARPSVPRNAGSKPKNSEVSRAPPKAKAATRPRAGRSIAAAGPSWSAGARASAIHLAPASPSRPPARPIIRLSSMEDRMRRAREAPSAWRTPISRSRATPLASSSVARFAHAITMTTPTMTAMMTSGCTNSARISRIPRLPLSRLTRNGSRAARPVLVGSTVDRTARSTSRCREPRSVVEATRAMMFTHQYRGSKGVSSSSADCPGASIRPPDETLPQHQGHADGARRANLARALRSPEAQRR